MTPPRYRSVAFVHPDFDAQSGVPGLRTTPSGRLATVADANSVRQAVLLLLSTRPGERVNRPDYGCYLFRLAFAPNDDTTAGLAVHYVARAIERWEPRVRVVDLTASRVSESGAKLEVLLKYSVLATQENDAIAVVIPVDDGGTR